MNLTDALTQATANGWTDDSRYARSTVTAQISTVRDGFLAAITVHTTGAINWGIQSLTGKARAQRGQAPSIEAALDACDHALAAHLQTLF